MEKDFLKKLKGGLKRCPGHKFDAWYVKLAKDWFRCEKCKGFQEVKNTEEERITIKKLKV